MTIDCKKHVKTVIGVKTDSDFHVDDNCYSSVNRNFFEEDLLEDEVLVEIKESSIDFENSSEEDEDLMK